METNGFEPVGETFLQDFTMASYQALDQVDFQVNGNPLVYGAEFTLASLEAGSHGGTLLDWTHVDLLSKEVPADPEGQAVLLAGDWYGPQAIWTYIDHLVAMGKPAMVVLQMDQLHPATDDKDLAIPVVQVSKVLELKAGMDLRLDLATTTYGGQAVNIQGAVHKGGDRVNDDALILALPLSPIRPGDTTRAAAALTLIEQVGRVKQDLDREVQVLLYQGHPGSVGSGIHAYKKNPVYPPKDTVLFLSLVVNDPRGHLALVDDHAPFTRNYAWIAARHLEAQAEPRGLGVYPFPLEDPYERGIPSIQVVLDQGIGREGSGNWHTHEVINLVMDMILQSDY